ncbi:YceI family protein [Pedobacter sp. HMF7647]|uniref:YceI family protein n=1 Tax=Hufsiella arboris TaxID=2695275 RepID=A0A7K1Y9R0_9SPHI|nr:YceI family protein [Hufsiella arboris]MXV51081.1 YceI family protein [Hufsiella arboris]
MKKTLAILVFAASVSLMAFTNKPADEKFTVDTQKSTVTWIGRKVTGEHTGTIKLAGGTLVLNGGSLKSGMFDINMNSITTTDLQGEYAQKLIGHLQSDDFFSTAKNPVSRFVITKVAPAGPNVVNVTGDLTIKGITKPVTFPATVKKEGNAVVAVAKGVKVDRTLYDIRYGSKSFFESIGDKAIDNDFELAINLLATK